MSGEVEFDELYFVAGHKEQSDKVKQDTIKPLILKTVSQCTQIYTDEYAIDSRLQDWRFWHNTVNHSADEYVQDEDGDGFCEVHSNTIESVWSLLRPWLRPHRGISQDKLPLYLISSLFTMPENTANACYLHFWKRYSLRPWNPYRDNLF